MPRVLSILVSVFSLVAAASPLPDKMTFEAIARFLRENPDVRSVEAFVHALPKTYREHYVLMHTSASLQGSSFEQPRVLTVALDGEMALAFTGADEQARGNTVELWQFDRPHTRYEFRELVFGANGPSLSAANPPLCLGCHGADPRPIWGSYPVWKGAYAEFRDGGNDGDDAPTKAKHQAFVAQLAKLPRYRELYGHGVDDQSDHNVGFMHLLQETNNLRVARLIASTPFYADYKFAILGAHLCLADAVTWQAKFLPAALAAQHHDAYRPEFRLDNRPGAFELYGHLFEPRAISTASWATLIDPLDARSSSRFSITEPADYDDFSAGRVGYALASSDRELAGPAHVGTPEATGVVTLDPRTFNYLYKLEPAECDALARQSQERLGALLGQHSPAEIFRLSAQTPVRTPREVLQSCTVCHEGAIPTVPKIPFGDIPQLSHWLQGNQGAREKVLARLTPDAGAAQMPPGAPLPEAERRALRDFVGAL